MKLDINEIYEYADEKEKNILEKAFFKNQYKLKILKISIFMIILFIIISGICYFITNKILSNNPTLLLNLMNEVMSIFSDIHVIDNMGKIIPFKLFLNNARACLMSIILGFIPFIFLPILTIITNSILVGSVGGIFISLDISLSYFIISILPHGIFEIPAICLSVAIGICLCIEMGKKVINSHKTTLTFKQVVICTIEYYFIMVIPLLIIAALIESYLTPLIINLFI